MTIQPIALHTWKRRTSFAPLISRYRLSLNLSKTKITELPEPLVDSWTTQLHNALPWKNDSSGALTLYTHDAINFLDFAVHLNRAEPDGSVLKLASSLICHRAQSSTAATVFDYVFNLSWHYPILLPLLDKIDMTSEYYDTDIVADKFDKILQVNALHRRSDGMCWALYYLKQLKSQPSAENVDLVIQSGDAAAITLLSGFEAGVDAAVAYANELIKNSTLYELDQYWILLYQLFFHDRIDNPYEAEPTFEILKKYDVQFVDPPASQSKAEDYCFHLSHPFIKKEDRLSFQAYLEKHKE